MRRTDELHTEWRTVGGYRACFAQRGEHVDFSVHDKPDLVGGSPRPRVVARGWVSVTELGYRPGSARLEPAVERELVATWLGIMGERS